MSTLHAGSGRAQLKSPIGILKWKVVDQQHKLLGIVQEVPALPLFLPHFLLPQTQQIDLQPLTHLPQVIQPQAALNGNCPMLRIQAVQPTVLTSAHQASEQHLIPWVPAIIHSIYTKSQTIVIAPPPGLLELGRQQALLDSLRPEIVPYGKPPAGSMAERLGQRYMPTKSQLAAAGRQDLVKLITSAGGFIHVAHLLGLRAKRKPEGQRLICRLRI